jgi:TonB family protein
MFARHAFKIAIVTVIALQGALLSTHAQRRGLDTQVNTGNPPGLIKKVEPEYPPGYSLHGAEGRGIFRLTINPKSGLVDELKVVKSTGYKELNELAAKALLQWKFQPGTRSPVEVPVEFYVHGGNRILH